ncbi:MAG: response regulator [Nitrospinae bacterium]|nr:response regulator [Nitrospinota bacterium]
MNKGSILLVDDEEALLYALEKELTDEGYEVDSVEQGKEALRKLETKQYDLTITDIMLGDINGLEILKNAKSKSSHSAVIMITGHGELSTAIESLRLGAYDYIEKPCERGVFISTVNQAVDESRLRKELSQKYLHLENTITSLEIEAADKSRIQNLLEKNQLAMESRLETLTQDLKNKSIALREILVEVEKEKFRLKECVQANVEHFIVPILEKIKQNGNSSDKSYIKLLEKTIEGVVSEFGLELSKVKSELSSKEIEICNMVRSGLSSKEIADTLNISPRTIDTHRTNIRKKLKLSNQKVNLSNFLKKL